MIEEINIRNSNNRLVGWTTIKKKLIENGYKVIEDGKKTTVNKKRLIYSIIEK